MGVVLSRNTVDFEVIIKTGDIHGKGTDSNVSCQLIDELGNKSRDLLLDVHWRNDFEKGSTDEFKIKNVSNLARVTSIKIWHNTQGSEDDWFIHTIFVKQYKNKLVRGDILTKNPIPIVFPCNRWILPNKPLLLIESDFCLPQDDQIRIKQRKEELEIKRQHYQWKKVDGMPRIHACVPDEEHFSNEYQWDIVGNAAKLTAQSVFVQLLSDIKWKQLNDMLDVYKGSFGIPYGYYNWKSDKSFGQQRLTGCNPMIIKLCTKIPENFPLTDEIVSSLLDGLTLEELITRKELFLYDLKLLDNLPCKDNRTVCAPIALFHAKKDGSLMPIAIQLFQQAGVNNPIFLPTDPSYTWMLAKIYLNNADAMYHQANVHLGFTHLVCETFCIGVHRTLSPSHPVFRLLAPHFIYLIAINSNAVEKLLADDGWVDQVMTMGVVGMKEIIKRKWAEWRLDEDGWLPTELKNRGSCDLPKKVPPKDVNVKVQLDDPKLLSSFLYRDDALSIHEAIVQYVTEVLTKVYDSPSKLLQDNEIQDFAANLVDVENGCGVKGVFGNGTFKVLDDVIKTVSSIIMIASVQHAAVNFVQYDEYGFPPNYPAILNGEIPKDKKPRTEQDIIDHLPDKDVVVKIMVMTKILSERGTKPLGDFEVQYLYEPNAAAAVRQFRTNLHDISVKIKERNRKLEEPYTILDPDEVPNAISI